MTPRTHLLLRVLAATVLMALLAIPSRAASRTPVRSAPAASVAPAPLRLALHSPAHR